MHLAIYRQAGAEVDSKVHKILWTPLYMALESNGLDVVRILLEHGADPDATARQSLAPSHFARSAAVVELLLANDAIVSIRDGNGSTPLYQIVERDRRRDLRAIHKLIVRAGANIDAKDDLGHSAIHYAIK